MKVVTVPGQTYVVYAAEGATITAPGVKDPLLTCEGGKPNYVTVPGGEMEISDPEATYAACRNFKGALAALGLLGGGNTSGLPAGYTRVEFLESTGKQYIKVELPITPNTRVVARAAIRNKTDVNSVFAIMPGNLPSQGYGFVPTGGAQYPGSFAFNSSGQIYKNLNLVVNIPYVFEFDGYKLRFNGTDYPFPSEPEQTFDCFVLFAYGGNYGNNILCRKGVIFGFEYFDTTTLKLTPALNEHGIPCMFDTVSKQPFQNLGTGSFIVGMTLEQARKLGKLPSTGGTLTVSLPSNYAEGEGVVNALATAQENGWVITIQTYEDEAGAVSTFALRRIWVRKRADENGSYVDADGFRWQVEWCVDVIGADPESLGYERFRSVDAAADYWGLTPYVEPETELETLTEA